MALTSYHKIYNVSATLNQAAAWQESSVPNATTALAIYGPELTSSTGVALGASLTWGKLLVTNPAGTNNNIAATAGATLTLTPTDAEAAGVGFEFTSAGTSSLGLNCAVALGSDQTWQFSSGRFLNLGGALSGAYNLTLQGNGRLTASAANTYGGAGKTTKLQSGAYAISGSTTAFGVAATTVDIGDGGFYDNNGFGVAPVQTQFRATGLGTYYVSGSTYTRYTAIAFGPSAQFPSSKTLTLYGTNVALSLYGGNIAATITGGTSDYIELSASGSLSGFTNTLNDFTATGGVRISSLAISTLASNNFGYNVGATDAADTAALGNAANAVRVMPSGRLYSAPAGGVTRTISRTVSLDGTPVTGDVNIQNGSSSATAVLAFAGDVTFSNTPTTGGEVKVDTGGSVISFQKTISGTGGLRLASATAVVAFESAQAGAFSSWSGALTAPNSATIQYGNGYATLTNALVTTGSGSNATVFVNKLAQNIALNHSSYTFADDVVFRALNSGYEFSLGTGAITGTSGTVFIAGTGVTLKLANPINSQLVFGKTSDLGTVVVSGTNTRSAGTIGWQYGSLHLNSAGSLGSGSAAADAFVLTGTPGTLDNSSGGTVVLTNGGGKTLNANFTWAGSNSLDLGAGLVTWNAARTFTFDSSGGTGTLKFPGATNTSTATLPWNIGGSTAGAKQRLTLGGANVSLANTTATNQHAVTAGYFRIENNDGLGAAATTTAWWVGATNAGTPTTGSALELAGVTTPNTKNVNLYGTGPNSDGALIGASGTSTFQGSISVPNVAGARIGVAAGATLTLDGAGIYPNLNPAVANTPISFTAGAGGTLNQNRVLGGGVTSNVSTVTIANGTGTVVFSRANLHTGAMTCSAGTTKITNAAATGASAGNTVTVTAGASFETTVKATFASTLTLGSSSTPAIFKVSV